MAMNFIGAATVLSRSDIIAEAARLRCEPAAVWAVCDVESAGHGFLPDKRPVMLFEAHIFGKLTRHRFDRTHPDISASSWNRALYGPPGAHQYRRLAVAIALCEGAALEAASWGMFQILGANFAACGFDSVESYVTAICEAENRHLLAFGEFCRQRGLDQFLRRRDWTRFALGYNGPAAADNEYDDKLAAAYLRRRRQPAALSFEVREVGASNAASAVERPGEL